MIGGKSYDEYLREQERKNRGNGMGSRDNYRPEVPAVEGNDQKTQTSAEVKKAVQPVSIFFILFGGVFFLFGMFFIALFVSVMPMDEEVFFVIFFVPGIFVILGLGFIIAGTHYARTGTVPGHIVINGMTPDEYNRVHGYDPENATEEDNDEDSSRLSTDWKS